MKIAQYHIVLQDTFLQPQMVSIANSAYEFTEGLGKSFFSGNLSEISVRIEEGSTKFWVSVGTLTTLLFFYGDLRTSIDYAYRDGKALVRQINAKFLSKNGIAEEKVIRKRYSYGTLDQLNYLFKGVERGILTADEATEKAVSILGEEEVETEEGKIIDVSQCFSDEFKKLYKSKPLLKKFSDMEASQILRVKEPHLEKVHKDKKPKKPRKIPTPKKRGVLVWRDNMNEKKKTKLYTK